MRPMRFVSWNVNGLRACMGKGFEQFFTPASLFDIASSGVCDAE